jgi:integration host factor subunit beta
MTRSDLIAELAAANPHLRQADVELIVALVFDQVAEALARGQRVELRGFGNFTVRRMKARVGRNPKTGQEVPVSEKAKPHFRTGRELHARLNRGETAGNERP